LAKNELAEMKKPRFREAVGGSAFNQAHQLTVGKY